METPFLNEMKEIYEQNANEKFGLIMLNLLFYIRHFLILLPERL